MLTPSSTTSHMSVSCQLPLFPASSRIERVLSFKSQFERIYNLLLDWSDKYGKVSIHVDETAIIVENYRIALEDIAPKNTQKYWIEILDYVSFSPRWDFLTTKPGLIDMVSPEAWMVLIDQIPGAWAERRDNLLKLLGNECFSRRYNFYNEEHNSFAVYHTNESLWANDGHYYWQLFIHSLPIPLKARHCSDFIGEYAHYPIDHELWSWGDGYIHFDSFNSVIAPPASIRLQV